MKHTSTGTRTRKHRRAPLFLAVGISFSVLLAARLWFITDDAFISFRYARNWVEGAGLCFNPGTRPPVEGFSNFSWTALMAGADLLGLDPVRWSCRVSAFLGFLLLLLLWRAMRSGLALPSWAAFLGLLVAGLSPAFATWASGGLETMLFSLLLFAAYLLFFVGPVPHAAAAGFCAGLLCLTRPEGIVWALALALLFLLPGGGRPVRFRRQAVIYLAVVLLCFAPYLVFRYLYFGELLPNTYYAKAVRGAMPLKRGFFYTASYLLSMGTPLLILLTVPWIVVRRAFPRSVRVAAVILTGFFVFAVFSGGDFMAFGRFFAPAAPFFGLAAATLLAQEARRRGEGRVEKVPAWLPAALLVCLVQTLPAFGVELMPGALRQALHFRWNTPEAVTELQQWHRMRKNVNEWTIMGRMLKRIARPGDSYVGAAIGAVGYYSGLTVYDMCGLVDREVARRKAENPVPRSPGHDKYVEPEFFLPRRPTFLRVMVVPKRLVSQVKDLFSRNAPSGYEVKSLPVPPAIAGGRNRLFCVMQRLKR